MVRAARVAVALAAAVLAGCPARVAKLGTGASGATSTSANGSSGASGQSTSGGSGSASSSAGSSGSTGTSGATTGGASTGAASASASSGSTGGAGSSGSTGGAGYQSFLANAYPVITGSACSACHSGARFAFASATGDPATDYEAFFPMISLDRPEQSRILAKLLPGSDPAAIDHAGGALVSGAGDPIYAALMRWIKDERAEKCPDCGLAAPRQWIAYVRQPNTFWSMSKIPTRTDWGLRQGARIMLQRAQPSPDGSRIAAAPDAPVDFLAGSGFCESGDCDFGHLASNHAGTRLAFECRLSVAGEAYLERSWNICLADVDPATGKAVNPHLLMAQPLAGFTFARVSPFMLGCFAASPNNPSQCQDARPDPQGAAFAVAGIYDRHAIYRQRREETPLFSADDSRLIFSSMRPDPRTGEDSVQTYHGTLHLQNLVSARLDGSDLRTVYRNEGGFADLPFLLADGAIAFHAWALDRIDRNMYLRVSPGQTRELSVLVGRMQGPNMWGKATQLEDGLIVGLTGNRRGGPANYQPFAADHTLGTGMDPAVTSLRTIGPDLLSQFAYFTYCSSPPSGTNCHASEYFADPSWSPDGRALVAHNTSTTYFGNNAEISNEDQEAFYLLYHALPGGMAAYLPQSMGISAIDKDGHTEVLIPNGADPSGNPYLLRYPTWVGHRQAPRTPPALDDESASSVTLHIADFRSWLSLTASNDTDKSTLATRLSRITSVRVLAKEMTGNACLQDGATRTATNSGFDHDHPVPMGANNATGFVKFEVPASAGGDGHGDVPLQADGSVLLQLPAGRVLLFQGIDADGFSVAQHDRLFALPPRSAGVIHASVPKAQYASQCLACHGSLDGSPYVGLAQFANQPGFQALDYGVTQAMASAPVDLTSPAVGARTMTFKDQLRPILEARCVSCHSGESPAGGLSLQEAYSPTGNYPADFWAAIFADSSNSYFGAPAGYTSFIPAGQRVPSYNSSPSYAWMLHPDDNPAYPGYYAAQIQANAPIADLSPWDLGYQNLMLASTGNGVQPANTSYTGGTPPGGEYVFLSQGSSTNFGRGMDGASASRSYLLQVLTGRALDPTRTYTGSQSHLGLLTDAELRTLMGVIDVGFPYMSRCDGRSAEALASPGSVPSGLVRSGPYQGLPYGDPQVRDVPLGYAPPVGTP